MLGAWAVIYMESSAWGLRVNGYLCVTETHEVDGVM